MAEASELAAEPASQLSMARVARVAKSLLSVHVEVAKREARRDKDRLVVAAVCAVLGAAMLAMVVVLLDGAAVVAIWERGLPLWLAILAVAGGNLILGGIFLFIASSRARVPVMPETRSLVQKTLVAITDA